MPNEIICTYTHQNFFILSQIYTCVIKSVTSTENTFDFSITGTHMAGRNDKDLMGLYGSVGNVQKFPKGFERFTNLKAIYLYSGQIREIRPIDLKPFPELMEVYFDKNQIEIIEDGIFEFNPKLVGISFKNNKVFHISPNVFDHLTELIYLWLNKNPCPNDLAKNSRNGVLKLIETVKTACQSPTIIRLENKARGVCGC